jgi:hypothetical protein
MKAIRLPDRPQIPDGLPADRVVAYLDILGMRTLVHDLFAASDTEGYRRLFEVLWALTATAEVANQGTLATPSIRATAFSDTIVFSDEFTARGVESVVKRAGLLISTLLPIGIFCRGAIDAGPTYHDNGIILGKGLISAHDLETRVAIYPRVVISDDVANVADDATKHGFSHLYKDCDGMCCIDAFYHFRKAKSIQELLARPIGNAEWDPDLFEKTRHHIQRELAEATSGRRTDLLVKHRWLAKAFNQAVDRYVPGSVQHLDLQQPRLGA